MFIHLSKHHLILSLAGLLITFVEVVWAIECHLDSCLGVCVLGLQHFYRLPQLCQLGLL